MTDFETFLAYENAFNFICFHPALQISFTCDFEVSVSWFVSYECKNGVLISPFTDPRKVTVFMPNEGSSKGISYKKKYGYDWKPHRPVYVSLSSIWRYEGETPDDRFDNSKWTRYGGYDGKDGLRGISNESFEKSVIALAERIKVLLGDYSIEKMFTKMEIDDHKNRMRECMSKARNGKTIFLDDVYCNAEANKRWWNIFVNSEFYRKVN